MKGTPTAWPQNIEIFCNFEHQQNRPGYSGNEEMIRRQAKETAILTIALCPGHRTIDSMPRDAANWDGDLKSLTAGAFSTGNQPKKRECPHCRAERGDDEAL